MNGTTGYLQSMRLCRTCSLLLLRAIRFAFLVASTISSPRVPGNSSTEICTRIMNMTGEVPVALYKAMDVSVLSPRLSAIS